MRGLADRGPRVGDFHGPRTAAYIYIYIGSQGRDIIIIIICVFFSEKNDVPGIFMPCVCVMHCRRRFFFGKNDVPGSHGVGLVTMASNQEVLLGIVAPG